MKYIKSINVNMNWFYCITQFIILLAVLAFSGCKQKDANQEYLPMSLEYKSEFLASKVEFKQIGIEYQPIKDWEQITDNETMNKLSTISSKTPLTVLAAYQLPGMNSINIISQLPIVDEKTDDKTVQTYIDNMAAQSDTVFSNGKYSHSDVFFDQIVTRRGELVYIQLIGKTKTSPNRFTLSYIFPEKDSKDMIKKVEASISSIKVTGR